MSFPRLSTAQHTDQLPSVDVLVIGVHKTDAGPRTLPLGRWPELDSALADIGVSGAADELVRLPSPSGVAATSIALVGIGTTVTADSLRYAAGVAGRRLLGIDSLALTLPADTDADATAILEGAGIGAYAYLDYRAAAVHQAKSPASSIALVSERELPAAVVRDATAVVTATHEVRDLVNAPPIDLYPASFVERARALADGLSVSIKEWDETALAADGFGGILGVGQGSSRPPRLLKVEWAPANATGHLALVGKGITFDTGGLSLKPPASMVGMKYDMTGAATVLAVTLAAARLALPVRITAWMCLAENMPSATAIRPNDVLRIRGGKTVEVLNTDAEGRLVLADGLVAAGEQQPDAIVDVATLTGAAVVALGNRYIATMGDEDFVSTVLETADATGEPLWRMPLPSELRQLLDSDVADIANAKIGNTAGGMLLAGVFLREFVPENDTTGRPIPWAHLDIAGAANNGSAGYGFTPTGATGTTVRTLIELARRSDRWAGRS